MGLHDLTGLEPAMVALLASVMAGLAPATGSLACVRFGLTRMPGIRLLLYLIRTKYDVISGRALYGLVPELLRLRCLEMQTP